MNSICQIYYIGLSDFLDRIRSKSILIITFLMMYIAYLFFPQNDASIYYTLNFNLHGFLYRGIYNSVWLGWVATTAFISIVTLIGFYFVRNSIGREKQLMVGEITAAMPVRSSVFIFGKVFGNLLFLLLQMLVVIFVTVIMQFVRGESYFFEPIKFLTPFILLAVPACFIMAIIAIIFETIPVLSKSLGNIVYFFVWSVILIISIQGRAYFLVDVFGMNTSCNIILEQLKANFKQFENINSFNLGASGALHNNIKTFLMDNVNIGSGVLIGRCFWILMAILLGFLAAVLFRRTLLTASQGAAKKETFRKEEAYTSYNSERKVTLSEIFEKRTYSNDLEIIRSEFKLTTSSLNIWWYIVTFACCIGALFANGDSLYKFLIPVIWILPVFIWSKLGNVQINFNMEDYLRTYKNYRNSQLMDSIAAGMLFTLLINATLIVRFLLSNNFLGAVYILMGIFFVNALGMFIGNFTRSSTAFEIIYMLLWYVGIMNGLANFDFLGITQKAAASHIPIIFLAIGVVLMIASILIKNNRINNLHA